MSFSIQDHDLLLNDKKIFSAPGPIVSSVTDAFQDRAIITYDARDKAPDGGRELYNHPMNDPDLIDLVNRNVLMVDKQGQIIWKIQTHDTKPSCYTGVWIRDGVWYAYLDEGYRYQLDIETGRTYNPVFTK